ncbi:TPA: YSIRK-type signal peptide-containing protein, partial [Streptococcus suis]
MLDKKKINFSRKRMTTPDKRYRYSIRKFNVGIASVAIAAFMFLGNGAVSVSASELPTTEEAIPTSGPVSEEVLPSSTEITETEPVSSSTPPTETLEETPTALPAQTEKVVTEETVPATENADSLPTNESQQESLSTTESDDALAAAKKVLEEVISEAEVLSADALRKAAKQPEQATALETAANETKAVAEAANKVFADEAASLEEVNAQITAIRTSVDSLVREVRNQTGTEDIQVMLTATTATETPADDADKSVVTAISDVYTAKTQKVTSFTNIPDNAIVVIQSEADPAVYTYKRFEGAVNLSTIKTAYDVGGQFVDAATFGKDQVKENETIYVVKEADLKKPTSIEETYDLTEFHHREHLLINPNDLSLAALARPGTFSADIKFLNRKGFPGLSKDFPAENNTILVTELTNKKAYADMSPEEQANYNLTDGYDQNGYDTAYTHDKYNFFLSHIDGTAERTSKKNSVFDLPPGVVVAFKDADGNPVPDDGSIENKGKIDQIFKQKIVAAYDEDGNIAPSLPMEFKFQVYKDGKLLKEDDSWRSVTLHTKYRVEEPKEFIIDGVTYDNFSTLITTKVKNTVNNFEAGIVDNIDFSELPEPLKNEAVEMEKTTPNLDGTLPEDGQLPSFTRPDGKNVKWSLRYRGDAPGGGYYVLETTSDNQHGTSPFRVWPNHLGILNGTDEGYSALRTALKAFHDERLDGSSSFDKAGNPIPGDQLNWDEATKEKYKYQLQHIYDFFEYNMEGVRDYLVPTIGANNADDWQSIENYWSSPIKAQPIPNFEFVPADINLEELTIERQITPKGSVKIVYKALKADGTAVDSSVVLKADVTDTEDAAVDTPWNAAEQEKDEKPETLTHEATNTVYHLVKTAVVVPGVDGESTQTEGTVVAGETVVTYYYAPEQTETIPTDNTAKVTVNYYILGTSRPLQPNYEDTPATKISETVTTNTYYLNANGERVPVGTPTVVTNPVDPAVTYDTTETKNGKEERPTTLELGGTTYHLVEAATTFTDGTGISGNLTKDTVVNYYYAEILEEVTTVPTNGSVTIKYETTEGAPLRDDKEDTASTVISTKTTTKKYYEYDGKKVYVGDPVVTTTPTEVNYNTTEEDKDEKPSTLEKDGKTYQRVAVKAGSADENGKVTGDHVVTYVYAEIKDEVTTEPTTGSVTIKYETTEGAPLRDDKEDTASTVISTQTTTKKYYEYDGQKVYVGDPVVTTTPTEVN